MKGLRKSDCFWESKTEFHLLKVKTAQVMAAESDYALLKSVFENVWFESDMIRTNWEETVII